MSVNVGGRQFVGRDDFDMPSVATISFEDNTVHVNYDGNEIVVRSIYTTGSALYFTDGVGDPFELMHLDSGPAWADEFSDKTLYFDEDVILTDEQYTWLTVMFEDMGAESTIYIATDTDLTAVADAIRTKGGTSELLEFPNGFISAINNIITISNTTITINTSTYGGEYNAS